MRTTNLKLVDFYACKNNFIYMSTLRLNKKDRQTVEDLYLPYILEREESGTTVRQFKLSNSSARTSGSTARNSAPWKCGNTFDNSMTFRKLVLDSEVERTILDDLNIYMESKESYENTGKAWRRNYLIYGPPGSGKSNLIAAVANHLNYDIYEFDKQDFQRNLNLSSIAHGLPRRSILVIKDLDFSDENESTISRQLLQVIDGLWCSREELITIFTASNEETVSKALLRPGRVDMQIFISKCTVSTFKQLVSHYHEMQHHKLFREVEELIEQVEVGRNEIMEQLNKTADLEITLKGPIELLRNKKLELEIALKDP